MFLFGLSQGLAKWFSRLNFFKRAVGSEKHLVDVFERNSNFKSRITFIMTFDVNAVQRRICLTEIQRS